MPNDLTWQQVKDHRETPLASFDIAYENTGGAGTIVIRIASSEITSADGIDSKGVSRFVNKFLGACSKAQTTANQNIPSGQRLVAFPTPTFSSPTNIDGILSVSSTQQAVTRSPVNTNQVVGNVG